MRPEAEGRLRGGYAGIRARVCPIILQGTAIYLFTYSLLLFTFLLFFTFCFSLLTVSTHSLWAPLA